MIETIEGNIFNCNEDIIAHQTNCLGIMGGGVALQVRRLFPTVFRDYAELCEKHTNNPAQLLGHTQFCATGTGKVIANCFGQNSVGSGRQTDYDALRKSLEEVHQYATQHHLSVAIPYNIGCGLAGGDWSEVSKMIEEIFGGNDVKCVLYKYVG